MSMYVFCLKHANGGIETVSIREVNLQAATERVQKLYPSSSILWSL